MVRDAFGEYVTMEWFEYFKLPVKRDSVCEDLIWDSYGFTIFSGDGEAFYDSVLMDAIVSIINGHPYPKDIHISATYYGSLSDSNIVFVYNNTAYRLYVRGWGYLRSVCDLSPIEAAECQDEFANKLVEAINTNTPLTQD